MDRSASPNRFTARKSGVTANEYVGSDWALWAESVVSGCAGSDVEGVEPGSEHWFGSNFMERGLGGR